MGTVAGIRIRIHWGLLLFWLFQLDRILRAEAQLWIWFMFIGLSFFCILLHEFGHCFAARAVGGSADDILMWPLGGLAYCSVPRRWGARFFVSAAGPLVTLLLVSGFFLLSHVFPAFSADSASNYLWFAYFVLVTWQLEAIPIE